MPATANQLQLELVDHKGKSLSLDGAVISAKALNAPVQKPSDQQVSHVAQRQRQFDPYISVVQAGSKISFPNYDQVSHHVYSFSKAKQFELPLYKQQLPEAISFDKTGLVILGCNIHDWMLAYIQVVDTPFFGQFNTAKAELELPAGEYQLELWHPDLSKKENRFKKISLDQAQQKLVWRLAKKTKSSLKAQTPEDFGEDY